MPAAGPNPDFLLGGARALPPSADIGPRGQSVGQAAQFCLGPAAAQRACGGISPAIPHLSRPANYLALLTFCPLLRSPQRPERTRSPRDQANAASLKTAWRHEKRAEPRPRRQ